MSLLLFFYKYYSNFNLLIFLGKDQPFWNQTLTWDTDVPTLTRCFRRTIFTSLPLAFFWLVFPFHVRNLRQKTLYTTRKLSVLSTVKYLLAGFLCLVAIIDLLYWVLDQHYTIMDLIESVFRAVTFLAVIFLIRVSWNNILFYYKLFFCG